MLNVNELNGFGVGNTGINATDAALVERASLANAADSTSYTFANVNIGAAQPDRRVVICVRGLSLNTSAQHAVTATIAGVAADVVLNPRSGVNSMTRAIVVASVPNGATATINIITSSYCASMLIGVYTLTGTQTPNAPLAIAHAAGRTISDLDTRSGRAALLFAINGGTNSWAGDISATASTAYSFEGSFSAGVALLNENTPPYSTCTYAGASAGVLACVW